MLEAADGSFYPPRVALTTRRDNWLFSLASVMVPFGCLYAERGTVEVEGWCLGGNDRARLEKSVRQAATSVPSIVTRSWCVSSPPILAFIHAVTYACVGFSSQLAQWPPLFYLIRQLGSSSRAD
jgi:hypothetical protein